MVLELSDKNILALPDIFSIGKKSQIYIFEAKL